MAVIDVKKTDLEKMVGKELSIERLEQEGSMLGILFERSGNSPSSLDRANASSSSSTDEDNKIAVEVEPNRPDLLSAEGVARALKGFFEIETGAVDYPVTGGDVTVTVDDSVEDVRPFIACARITGLELSETALNSLIQLQEKLTETYGRKREKIAIGLHDAAPLTDDITYKAVDPAYKFIPLGHDTELSMAEILEDHEKGKEYGWIVEDFEKYPLIVDSEETVLSFPPVINGVATAVTTETTDLFLDVTGTSKREVETALNILVAAAHERGGTIESVTVDGTELPDMERETHTVDPDYVRSISGLDDLSADGMAEQLETLNYGAHGEDGELQVEVPAYRADIMHDYDIIEDVVIGYGYDNLNEHIPDIATIGAQTQERVFTDKLRELMVGAGGLEVMTFILSNRDTLFGKMDRDDSEIVTMANPLTEDYAVVRNWLLPSLMEVLGNNQHNRYPQTVFEVGLCSQLSDDTATGAEDMRKLAYAAADRDVGFSDVRSVLQSLARWLGVELRVEEADHESFTENRCGTVYVDGHEAGIIGEISDSVSENWGLEEVDVAAFELDVETLRTASE